MGGSNARSKNQPQAELNLPGCGVCAADKPRIAAAPPPVVENLRGGQSQVGPVQEIKDLCTELQEPSCVYSCPHDAAHRVNAREFFMAKKTE